MTQNSTRRNRRRRCSSTVGNRRGAGAPLDGTRGAAVQLHLDGTRGGGGRPDLDGTRGGGGLHWTDPEGQRRGSTGRNRRGDGGAPPGRNRRRRRRAALPLDGTGGGGGGQAGGGGGGCRAGGDAEREATGLTKGARTPPRGCFAK
jgi:hypothetical protein